MTVQIEHNKIKDPGPVGQQYINEQPNTVISAIESLHISGHSRSTCEQVYCWFSIGHFEKIEIFIQDQGGAWTFTTSALQEVPLGCI